METDIIITKLKALIEYQRDWIHRGYHTGNSRDQAIRHIIDSMAELETLGCVFPKYDPCTTMKPEEIGKRWKL